MTHPRRRSAMLIVSIVFVLAMAVSASAQSSASGTLTPGGNICVGPFYSNGTSIELSGQVTNDVIANPKWTIQQSPDDITYTKIFKTHAFGVTADILQSQDPQYFPGYFKGCLNNDTTVTIDFIISIGPGQF